jgi:hypothetical protein
MTTLDELRDFHPDQYEEVTGTFVLPTLKTSVEAARNKFLTDNDGYYIGYKAVIDKSGKKIPHGKCLVYAWLNSDHENIHESLFFVDVDRYKDNMTPFGYVVDEDLDEERRLK